MSSFGARLDTSEFLRTLRAYAQVSKTEPSKIVVRKAFFIVRAATRMTHKADPQAIQRELEAGEFNRLVITKRGKFSRNRTRTRDYAFAGSLNVERNDKGQFTQRIFKILAARLRKDGKPIPPADQFRDLAIRMLKARIASVAFLAAGFLPAIRRLAQIGAGLGVKGLTMRKLSFGKKENNRIGSLLAIGMGTPKVAVTIVNAAAARHDRRNALHRYAGAALQSAFNQETASTKIEIERRYRENARRLGIRTN